jgi:L-alanine-DL-glutamate epimerase-like enolase superfamily enzyme
MNRWEPSLKIARIELFPTTYTHVMGAFQLSGGRTFGRLEGVIVKVTTDDGITGWGEHVSAPTYMTAFRAAALPVIERVGTAILGADPRGHLLLRRLMDAEVRGHDYAKSALDVACWDITGMAAGAPLGAMLGGLHQSELPLHNFLPLNTPEAMLERLTMLLEQGFRHIQVKVGSGDWREDVQRVEKLWPALDGLDTVIVDANGFWTQRDALQFLDATSAYPFMLEQPCADLASHLTIRRHTDRPMILDESLDSVAAVEAAQAAGGFDAAMLKLSRFGGITETVIARDACVRWGKSVTLEDMGGGAIMSAVSAHLAASIPAKNLVACSLTGMQWQEQYGAGPQPTDRQTVIVPTEPGIGATVDEEGLGDPVAVVAA